jgi:hypothetical protein
VPRANGAAAQGAEQVLEAQLAVGPGPVGQLQLESAFLHLPQQAVRFGAARERCRGRRHAGHVAQGARGVIQHRARAAGQVDDGMAFGLPPAAAVIVRAAVLFAQHADEAARACLQLFARELQQQHHVGLRRR